MTMLNRSLLFVLSVSLFVGCGGGSDRMATVKVSGKVTFNGQPLEGAQVQFLSDGEGVNRGPAARGTTNAQGEYTLSTYEPGDGAVPGKKKVTITKTEGGADPGANTGEDGLDADALTDPAKMGIDPDDPDASVEKSVIPDTYANPIGTPLTAEVPESGPAEGVNFDLVE
ncbi:MAG: hypothetical protein CMJ78_09130 [Planctomycetaceae bacterium]|nr:hypothetical protein [Planctomycetaceae bacterium]